MSLTTPQRIITISIIGTGKDAQAFYSYLSPVTGQSYINAPLCDLLVNQPVYCLFVLDYASTMSGWTIVNTSPYGRSPELSQTPGALNLSVLTYNPHTTEDKYQFYINYLNTITNVTIGIDPQEGNIPR
ncbi:hypothetical protein ACHAC9_00780 [Massilia sp. CMS3.1]|uniref:hypothetical protein n=1 Tax=Massilia sp. CMS3.1 TaxID=3373083 RepID=UPI003EE5606F